MTKQYTENLTAKLKTQIKILPFPGLAYSGSEQPGPGAKLLGLAKLHITLVLTDR